MEDEDRSKNILQFIFQMEEINKFSMMNIMQYTVIAIIPIMLFQWFLQTYTPRATISKSSIEISLELIMYLGILFIGLYFIHRFVIYFPPYSNKEYPRLHIIYFIIPILFALLVVRESNFSQKINILRHRIYNVWNGTQEKYQKEPMTSNENATQDTNIPMLPTQNNINNNNNGTLINQLPLPTSAGMEQFDNPQQKTIIQNEPVAANSMLGGNWTKF